MSKAIFLTVVFAGGMAACTHRVGYPAQPATPQPTPVSVETPAPAPVPIPLPAAAPSLPAEHAALTASQPIEPAKPKPSVPGNKPVKSVAAAKPFDSKPAKESPPAAVITAPTPQSNSPSVANASKPSLDFKAMEQRLRDTSAIGVFTKLSIKNQVDDLLKAFRVYHAGRTPPTLDQLHQRYDGLLLKVVTLVQDDDATLASSISASRNAIWERLSNRESFQAI